MHEAAEMQAFANQGVNPFDIMAWKANWKTPHLHATVFELQYLREWAKQLEMDAPELAFEIVHPIRGGYVPHTRFVSDLQAYQNWSSPSETELEAARQFWQQIQRGKP